MGNHVIKYCVTFYERNSKRLFWTIKNSGDIFNKLKPLNSTLPHNLIKEKLTELIEQRGIASFDLK